MLHLLKANTLWPSTAALLLCSRLGFTNMYIIFCSALSRHTTHFAIQQHHSARISTRQSLVYACSAKAHI